MTKNRSICRTTRFWMCIVCGAAPIDLALAAPAFFASDLEALGGNSGVAFASNTGGQVTGYSQTTGNAVDHAFLYTSGSRLVDLNPRIDPSLGWRLKIEHATNDAGEITRFGQIGVQDRANSLTPVSGPASLPLLVLGLPLLDWRARRRRSEAQLHLRRLRLEPLEERQLLATFMVDNLNDAGAGSFRQAILDANGLAGADTIKFESVAGTIALTSGEMEITEAVAIDGPGQELLTIDARENSRILNITALTGDVALHGLTLTGGRTTGENVDFYDSTFNGGAVRSLTTGNLTITNCTVSGNSTTGYVAAGGGVYASGDVTLTNSTLSGNHTTGYSALGGGLYTYGNVTLTNSAVSGNSTAGKYAAGGGISAYGAVTLTDSKVSGNHTLGESANGGGVNNFGDVTLNHSTVKGNHTEGINGSGGGIGSQGDVTLNSSTVSGNHTLGLTAVGGGIFNFGNVTLTASTVSGNHTEGEGASGGGIRANSSITLLNSTVSGNYTTGLGATGGGVWAYENVTLTNSTASGNRTGGDYAWGGGSFCYGNLTLISSTISGNHTAGIFANGAGAMLGEYGALTLLNSILAGNTAVDGGRPDLWLIGSVPPVLHFSLVGNSFGALLLTPAPLGSPDANGNLIGTADNPIDPMLRPLSDNGGPTLPDGSKILTQAPLPGSPAIDAGDPAAMAGVSGVPLSDQRGTPWSRVVGGRIDRGALELQSNPLTGDYNFNGAVDAADYSVYCDTLGSTIDLRADGSGDGSVGLEDFDVWKLHFGATLPPGAGGGSIAVVSLVDSVAPSAERLAFDHFGETVSSLKIDPLPVNAVNGPLARMSRGPALVPFDTVFTRLGHREAARSSVPKPAIHHDIADAAISDSLLLVRRQSEEFPSLNDGFDTNLHTETESSSDDECSTQLSIDSTLGVHSLLPTTLTTTGNSQGRD